VRCQICDKLLSDFESTRKDAKTDQYLDMCFTCGRLTNQFCTVDNYDLMDSEDEANLDIVDDDYWYIDNDDY